MLIFFHSSAQVNYVLNPSFEDYTQCPIDYDQIIYAMHWSSIDSLALHLFPSDGQPDYCNICGYGAGAVPHSFTFYHYPHTGNGFAQITTFSANDPNQLYKRDYLQGRLYQPLTAGKSYCVSFFTTLTQIAIYADGNIGAYLDSGLIDTTTCPGCIQSFFHPQVVETSIINDTLNWVKVEGTFIADGTERFITIGNYSEDTQTASIIVNPNGLDPLGVYLIDDVSVVESDLPAFAGNDTTIHQGDTILIGRNEEALDCKWYVNSNLIDSGAGIRVHPDTTTTYVVQQDVCGLIKYDTVTVTVWPLAVNDPKRQFSFDVYPNPSQGSFTISSYGFKNSMVDIFNAIGQLVYSADINNESQRLSIDIPNGLYIIELSTDKGDKKQKRLTISK